MSAKQLLESKDHTLPSFRELREREDGQAASLDLHMTSLNFLTASSESAAISPWRRAAPS